MNFARSRDAAHYRAMFARNSRANIGASLMAQALAAATDGPGAPADRDTQLRLQDEFGDAGVPAARALDMLREAAAAEMKRLRTRCGLSQVAMGKKLGVTGNTIARYERGELEIPEARMDLARRIAQDYATNWRRELRSRLDGSRSLARHGRCSPALRAARAACAALIRRCRGKAWVEAITPDEARAACAAHDQAVMAQTGVRRLSHPPMYP